MTDPQGAAEAAIAETHVSVVIMLGDRAFKLLKPVDAGFLDHRRREDRLRACRRETELNRRFSPDVYLGVLDVVDERGQPRDHLVAMRRMPAGRRLSALLDTVEGEVRVAQVAEAVAAFHRDAPMGPEIAAAGAPGALRRLWREGLAQMGDVARGVLAPAEIDRAGRLTDDYLAGRAALLEDRMAAGWVRDGHGDLLAEDIFCLDDGPRFLDCLAFDDRLRCGDVLADLAFLAMDLEFRGHPELAGRLVEGWAEHLGETHPSSLIHHYVAYRAHVRAKVALLKVAQGRRTAAGEARALHALTLARLERGRVRLVLVGGPPGTGKSTVAAALGARAGWPVLRSDEVRKDMAGQPRGPAPPSAYGEGPYAPETSRRVYDEMLARAARLLAHGESVVLDATWGRAQDRAAARRLATHAHASLVEIACAAPAGVAAARIRARRAAGQGSSDATPELAAEIAAAAEPWPEAEVLRTDRPLGPTLAEAERLVGPA